MIKILKSNKLITIFLLIICIFFIIKPSVCSSSCLNAISVWGLKVLPMLFPFFILTRLIVSLTDFKPNFMDKFFHKIYHAPSGSFLIFFLSVLAGYPMGAKLVSSMYKNGKITSNQAKKMLSFCSVSGPMFIMGTVGISIFNNYMVGIIALISNVLACLFNGLVYRGKLDKNEQNTEIYFPKNNTATLSDIVYDSLVSILMVGAYIVLSFIFIDVSVELGFISTFSNIIHSIFKLNKPIVEAFLIGIVEITRGAISINSTCVSLCVKTVLASSIIAFGGISVFMQSLSFLKDLKIKPKFILLQKFTQSLFCLVISIILSIIFL